jgi:hypothetical protein
MGRVAGQQAGNEGPCYGCHSTGTGSAYLNIDSLKTFDAHALDIYFLQKLVTCSFSQGQFQQLVPSNRLMSKGTEPCPDGEAKCHPDYVLSPGRQDAVEGFVQQTLDAMAAGTCADLQDIPDNN